MAKKTGMAGATGAIVLLVLAACVQPATSQDATGCFLARGTPEEAAARPSPLDSASVRLDGAEVKVCYGAPSANDREVMGGLVPFGTPWRAGANEATTLRVAAPVLVAGVRLEAGSYSLYVVPGSDSWEIILNGEHDRWGIPIDDDVRAADVGSGTVTPESTGSMVERLTFRFEERDSDAADLLMEWENTRVRIPVERVQQ
ncbi:MAG: DUF2911 domain-containing protein [Gemmatimonadota bacterium]